MDVSEPPESLPTGERLRTPDSAVELSVVEGPARGQRFRVQHSALIGRSADTAIMLDDPEVSRHHARLASTEAGFELEDMRSRNGTFVNGMRVERRLLSPGDKIRLGPNSVLELQVVDVVDDLVAQRQRFEAIGRLGLGVAHDLKNLLAALDAGVAFLRESPRERSLGDAETRECLSDLTVSLSRASELIQSLLSLGRASTRAPVELSSLLREALKILKQALGPNIRTELLVSHDVYVHANRSELQQVLLNLLLNARDAMPDGGLLKVVVEHSGDPAGHGRPLARVSVSDTGIGMDAQTRAHIFTRFFSTKREGAGYGLGLFMVHEIVTEHGGRIEVESAPGRGTKFTLSLPALDAEALRLVNTAERQRVSIAPPPASTPLSVLIVDDEAMLRRSLGRRLRNAGYDIEEAADGAAAIAAYAQRRFDLVVLDLQMPGLGGEETFATLVAVHPEIRVVFTTGLAAPGHAAMLRAKGALGLLEKPYTVEMLLELLATSPSFGGPTRPR